MVAVVVGVVVGAGAFYGGMKYAQGKTPRGGFANLSADQRQKMQAGAAGAVFRVGRNGAVDGGFLAGEVIAKDDKSITVKLRDGGSKLVFYSDATEVGKFVNGGPADLEIGKTVNITGKANQDGSLTAQSIQLRPIMQTPAK